MRTAAVMVFAATTLAVSLLAESAQVRLANSVKDARDQIHGTSTDLQNTVGALTNLQSQSGDLKPAYEKFSDSVEKTRNSAGLAAKLFGTMSANSETYFASWQSEIDSISNPSIQKASTKRLHIVQKEYAKALKELEPLPPLFAPMMSDLDDLKKALGVDLTPAGLKSLSKTMSKTQKSVSAFQEPVASSLAELDALATQITPVAPADE
jgi:hypothetical protein